MKHIFSLSALAALALLPAAALAQPLKQQIAGTWSLVSAETTNKDGSKILSFGPSPKGMVIFEPNGRYVQVNLSSSLPKFASGNRMTGTPESLAAKRILSDFSPL